MSEKQIPLPSRKIRKAIAGGLLAASVVPAVGAMQEYKDARKVASTADTYEAKSDKAMMEAEQTNPIQYPGEFAFSAQTALGAAEITDDLNKTANSMTHESKRSAAGATLLALSGGSLALSTIPTARKRNEVHDVPRANTPTSA